MSRKQMEALDAPSTASDVEATPTVEPTDHWIRQTAVQFAIDHHRINGGMMTVTQLIDNARQFNAYITGETK